MLTPPAATCVHTCEDTRVPLMIAAFSYLIAGFGTAYILGFELEFGGAGVWIGLAVGVITAAVLLLIRAATLTHVFALTRYAPRHREPE